MVEENTAKKLKDINLGISKIINETIEEYNKKGLKFFKSRYETPLDPYNWVFQDKKQKKIVFNGYFRRMDLDKGVANFKVHNKEYLDFAQNVSKKVEEGLNLKVNLIYLELYY